LAWVGLIIGRHQPGCGVGLLLLDTHLVLRCVNGDPRLPPVVQRVPAPQTEMFVSQATLWEMAIKLSIGWLQVDLPELERQVLLQGFRWLPISKAHSLAAAALETDGIQRDPFDRLLVCQSRMEPIRSCHRRTPGGCRKWLGWCNG